MMFWSISLSFILHLLSNLIMVTGDGDKTPLQFISANQSDFVQRVLNSSDLDVCFVVDLTWSMEPFLHGVKAWIEDLVVLLTARTSANLRMSFVGYRDVEDDTQFELLPFTSNTSDFIKFLNNIETKGGGDVPEDVFGALEKVSEQKWNAKSQKSLFHFTDAPCHHEMCGVNINDSADSNIPADGIAAYLKQKKIQYFFGQISTRTQQMISWFQQLLGDSIPIFDLGFDATSYSINNTKIKSFVTAEDLKNAEKLSQQLKEELAAMEANGASLNAPEMPWSDNLFEGDIDLRGFPVDALVDSINGETVPEVLSDFLDLENAVAEKLKLWPSGYVAYSISTRFTEKQRAVIALAIENFQTVTCVRFLASRGTEKDYINFEIGPISPPVCRSAVGRTLGIQDITLSQDCFKDIGIIMHEMMHAIGFIHEQSRSDRDNYVAIQWQNLPNGEDNANFLTYGVDKIDNLDTNYDYSSIMHYPRNIGGIEIVIPLIDVEIGQRNKLSETDIYKINALYSCLESNPPVCDTTIDCVKRAQAGECLTNSEHMLSECYKYCQLCHKKPSKEALEAARRRETECPDGWIKAYRSCYRYIGVRDFSEAETICQSEHPEAHLPAFKSASDWTTFVYKMAPLVTYSNLYIYTAITKKRMNSWIVNDCEGKMNCQFAGSATCETPFQKWEPGEPNNAGGHEDCVALVGDTFELRDIPCDVTGQSLVCQIRNFKLCSQDEPNETPNPSSSDRFKNDCPEGWIKTPKDCFKYVGVYDFKDARSICQREHPEAHLPVFRNAADLDVYVEKVVPSVKFSNLFTFYAATRDTKTGKWVLPNPNSQSQALQYPIVSDCPAWFLYWNPPDQPDNFGGMENCVVMLGYTFTFLDYTCNTLAQQSLVCQISLQDICSTDDKCYDEENECFEDSNPACQTINYTGSKRTTASGLTCQDWKENVPNPHDKWHDLPGNTCANPTPDLGPAWCYTMDPDVDWEYCYTPCSSVRVPTCTIDDECEQPCTTMAKNSVSEADKDKVRASWECDTETSKCTCGAVL